MDYLKDSKSIYYVKTDLEGNYTYASPYFLKSFNYKEHDIKGISSLLTIYHEDHQECIQTIKKCFLNPDKPQKVILRKPLDKIKIIWTQWDFILELDEKQQPKEIHCYGFDLSNKVEQLQIIKSFNRKVLESEIKYQTLFETSSLFIILHAPDGKIIDANETFCRLIGVEKNLINTLNLFDFIEPDNAQSYKELLKQQIVRSGNFSYETEIKNNEGSITPISLNPRAFHTETGDVLIWSITKDITERKHQKQLLENQNELLEHQNELLEETADIAKLGGWELNLTTLNTEWTKKVYDIHDLEPKISHNLENALSYYHPEDRLILTDALNSSIEKGTTHDLELRFVSAKKINKWVKVIVKPVYSNGIIKSISGTIQDITDKKTTEEILTKQNVLLKDLFFTQSHLIRLPIANILGLVDLFDLLDSEKDQASIIEKIKFSTQQLDTILKSVENKNTK